MKLYKFKINGNSYNVEIKSLEENMVTVEVNGSEYAVELEKEKIRTTKTPRLIRPIATVQSNTPAPVKASGKLNKVQAPLPGVILQIKVNAGDQVKKGQTLMIMEAMKMENNILADLDGTINSIKVKEGQNVLQGDILIEIE